VVFEHDCTGHIFRKLYLLYLQNRRIVKRRFPATGGGTDMKCDVIDHRCEPITAGALPSPSDHWRQLGNLATRLFWHRFLRAQMFDRAMRELARREAS
jgi:hypothetical protein